MKSNYIERAKKFVPVVYSILNNAFDLEEVEECVDDFNFYNKRKVIFTHGLTRMAFITSDYVIKFDYDPDATDHWGGSENEIAVYQQAEREGMDYLFAKITRFRYREYTFYIMPRIHGVERTDYDATEYMNADEYDWCLEHGICDLHSGNYGWRNRHICLIDYGCLRDFT